MIFHRFKVAQGRMLDYAASKLSNVNFTPVYKEALNF